MTAPGDDAGRNHPIRGHAPGWAVAVVALACVAPAAGCGPKAPDYQEIWTTSTTTTSPKPVPLAEYLKDRGVAIEPVAPKSLPDLIVSIPTPAGWSKRESKTLSPNVEVIGKGDRYPRAILAVLKITGNFDPGEVIKDSIADTELAQNFIRLDASTDDFHGFPSAMIQGSHDLAGQRVQTWFRIVVATGSPPANQRYLVQLTISTLADQAAAQAADVEAIIDGFTVADK